MQAGINKWEAAGFLAISVEILERVYGHRHSQHPPESGECAELLASRKIGGTISGTPLGEGAQSQAI